MRPREDDAPSDHMVRDERQPCLVDLLLFASGRSSTAEPRGVRDSEEPAVTLRKLQESFHEMPRSQPAVLCGPRSAAASAGDDSKRATTKIRPAGGVAPTPPALEVAHASAGCSAGAARRCLIKRQCTK